MVSQFFWLRLIYYPYSEGSKEYSTQLYIPFREIRKHMLNSMIFQKHTPGRYPGTVITKSFCLGVSFFVTGGHLGGILGYVCEILDEIVLRDEQMSNR